MTPHITAQFVIPNIADSGADQQELGQLEAALGSLKFYVQQLAYAQRYRVAGSIRNAEICEERCEKALNQLPLSWRW